jgi:arylsulfatase A-like enzyme
MKRKGGVKTKIPAVRATRIALRSGLLIAPLFLVLEGTWIFVAGGGFLRHHFLLSWTLCRYLFYGAAFAIASVFVAWPITRRLSSRSHGALSLAATAGMFFALELGLYTFDILAPVSLTPRPKSMLYGGVVAALALVMATIVFVGVRASWRRFRGILESWSWPPALGFLAAEAATAVVVLHFGAALVTLVQEPGQAEVERPNVVLIVLDTVRADALSCSGNLIASTPFLDRLAAEGVRYSHATSTSTWTPPGHASLFTGLYPISHGTRGLSTTLDENLEVLSVIMGRAGYSTLSLANNRLAGRRSRMDRGFHVAIEPETETKVSFFDQRLYYKYILRDTGTRKTSELLDAWIRAHKRGTRPWLAFLNLNDAHSPYVPREPWMGDFLGRLDVRPVDVDQRSVWRAMSLAGQLAFNRGEIPLGESDFGWMRAAYYSEVSAMDDQLGRTLQRLRDEGRLNNTIVIITSDHGEAIGEDGQLGHNNGLFATVVRIPLIFWAPGRLEPRVDNRWVSLVDVLPTLLDLTDVRYEPDDYRFDGRNLVQERIADEAVAEHTTIDREECDSFLLLRGGRGIELDCSGDITLLEVPEASLTSWSKAARDTSRQYTWLADVLKWRESRLADHDPKGRRSRADDADLLKKLRSLGYVD